MAHDANIETKAQVNLPSVISLFTRIKLLNNCSKYNHIYNHIIDRKLRIKNNLSNTSSEFVIHFYKIAEIDEASREFDFLLIEIIFTQ